MRAFIAFVLILFAGATAAECRGVAEYAAATARATYPELAGRQLEACSASADVVTGRQHVLLRFRPHESLGHERHHWQVSCGQTPDGGWACDHLGVTTTALVRPPDDWAELLGPLTRERAAQLASFAVAEGRHGFSYRTSTDSTVTVPPAQLTDIDYIIEGGGEFVLGFTIGSGSHVCLQITPRDNALFIFRVFGC
jgi:hypothetical protein